jgi:hypothetical protein
MIENTNDIENIKAKVKKLLALSKSDNENEAFIAMEKANKLINQYELDENALRFELVRVKSTKTYVPWRSIICNAVSWLYGCYVYRKCDHGIYIFIGEKLDAFLAGEMYTYLTNTIIRSTKKAVRKNAKYIFRRDFKYGMASRIYDRIMELGESCSWSSHRKIKIEAAKNFIERSVKLFSDNYKEVKLNRTAVTRGTLYADGVSLARQAGYAPVPQIASTYSTSVQK